MKGLNWKKNNFTKDFKKINHPKNESQVKKKWETKYFDYRMELKQLKVYKRDKRKMK